MTVDLAEPCVLTAPAVVHRHGALGERGDREAVVALLVGFVPDWQGGHRVFDTVAQMVGGLTVAVAFGSELKAAHRFDVERKQVRLGRII